MYFPFFKPQTGNKRFAAQPQTIYSEFPYSLWKMGLRSAKVHT